MSVFGGANFLVDSPCHRLYLNDIAVMDKLYAKYSDELGMDEKQIKAYLDKNYIQAQHVLISTQGLSDKEKAQNFCRQQKDLGRPWYGQLMAGPQLVAHYLQILYWLEHYKIKIEI